MTPEFIDGVLDDLTVNVRNNALDTAAKVAELYDAPKQAIDAILRLKNPPPLVAVTRAERGGGV